MTVSQAPTHLSYSQLSSWVKCGKLYELERVLRVPSVTTWAQVAGNAVHLGTEYLDRGEITSTIRDLWLDVFAMTIEDYVEKTGTDPSEWRATGRKTKFKPRGEDQTFWMTEGAQMLQRYKGWRLANRQWKVAQFGDANGEPVDAVELPLNIWFGDIAVQAVVDRVFADEDGNLIVVDIKSGAWAPKDRGQQVGIYAAGIEQIYGVRPTLGAYWMARTGEFSSDLLDLSRFSQHYWSEMTAKLSTAKREGIYLPNPGMFCDSCSVNKYCTTYGGELAGTADSLSTDS